MARAPGGACTTRCQLFNTEMSKNESKMRMRWFIKNRELLLENLNDERLAKKAVEMRKKLEENRQQTLRELTEKVEEDKPLTTWRPLNQDSTVNLDVMRPIDSSTRAILYKPGVESYVAGRNYLRARYKDKPEDRYYYPDCTSWMYGWRLDDYAPVPASKVGRTAIVRDSFYRRFTSSLQRDPETLRQCQATNAKNYIEISTA